MKKILLVIILSLVSIAAVSQDADRNIYSGGMLIFQPGYIITNNGHQDIQGINFGVGGILRFYFLNYFTAGIYGGTQRTSYASSNSENSYISLGYGGPILGLSREVGKFRYSFSAFIGKGTVRNLHIESQNNNLLSDAYFYKSPTVVYSPVFSIDYSVTGRLLLTVQTNCLAARYGDENVLCNPTLQIGILFNR
jgi:hypothetical protein